MSKTYIKLQREGFNTKYISDAFIAANRAAFKEYAKVMADGYNKIVSNWETDISFVPTVSFRGEIWTVGVFAKGDDQAVERFEGIDYGSLRSLKKKFVSLGEMKFAPSGPPKRFIKPLPPPSLRARLRSRDFAEHLRAEAEYDAIVSEARTKHEKEAAAMQRTGLRKAPMRIHQKRTDKGGQIGGPGTYIDDKDQIVFVNTWKVGDIEPRYFSRGLYELVQGGNDSFGMGKIWPGNMRWDSAVRRAYDRGVRQANAAGRR